MDFKNMNLSDKNIAKTIADIKVIGVGGAGNNAVNRMITKNTAGIDFIVANTDKQALENSNAPYKLVLGEKVTKGLGAGADPDVGERAARESEDEIKKVVKDADLIFVATGMGGGTGTGAAPVIAEYAKQAGALVIGIVTTPFKFEGRTRSKNASNGLIKFFNSVDSIIIVSNDRLLFELGNVPVKESFEYSDAILAQSARMITDLIAMPALINLDFADVKTVMKDQGPALIGIGNAKGENRAKQAAINAVNSPILEASIDGARNAIVNITGGTNFTLDEANLVVETIQDLANEDINIIFGVSTNDDLGDEIIVSVIATGLKGTSREKHMEKQNENKNMGEGTNKRVVTFDKFGVPKVSDNSPIDDTSVSKFDVNLAENETLTIDTFGNDEPSSRKRYEDSEEAEEDKEDEKADIPDFLKNL